MNEKTEAAHPSIIRRRRFHETAAIFCEKWLVSLHVFFATAGFFIVLLPTLSKPWRGVIEKVSIFAQLFHDYSTFSNWALINLYIGMVTALVRIYQKSRGCPDTSYEKIVRLKIYPKTLKEELSFFTDIFGSIFSATGWLFLPFGLIAYFIRIGS